MPTVVRTASELDAPALTRLAAHVFRDTFAEHNDPADIERYLAEAFTPERQAAEIANPNGIVLLAERSDDAGATSLVGYAHLARTHPPAAVRGPAPMELKRLYVERQWHGRGVARALMDAALDAARNAGARTLWLGVWERNPRASAFYSKYGFERAGEQAFLLGTDLQTDWILSRPLEDERPPARG